ncbi:MAG: DUF3616 domain-containing protein [Planctomycetes bacterium]|nr:DUF3616 domain-containing protein [Planctomycetota bacterium]
MKKSVTILIVLFVMTICAGKSNSSDKILKLRCSSDPSAAVAIDADTFVVADDENNILRFYKTTGKAEPVYSFNFNRFLGIAPKHPEADIEGAARIGDRIYWITSHGRNKDGKPRASRYQFFATDINKQGSDITLKPVGSSCFDLVHKIVKDKKFKFLGIDRATGFYDLNLSKKQRKLLAPKKQGLNIEGLCSSADGKSLYIGLRNPQYQDKAIVIQLLNPTEVIEKMVNPEFGEPILWDFKSRGIRSFEYNHYHKAYFIIAGPAGSRSTFSLYKWSGKRSSPPQLLKQIFPANFTPEALIVFDNKPEMLVLSDDGTIEVKVDSPAQCMEGTYISPGKCLNKHLILPQKQTFKAMWINP